MYLVDTSVWIRHFSKNDEFDLRSVCEPDERVLCLPIYQEILHGIRDDGAFRRIETILNAAVIVDDPMDRDLFSHAISLYRLARRQRFRSCGRRPQSSSSPLRGAQHPKAARQLPLLPAAT